MAKIKLVQAERNFIPDVDFTTDKGVMNNRDMEDADQVKCEITLANIEQKSKYIGSYSTTAAGKKKKKSDEIKSFINFHYQECIEKHCGKITGLEEFKVTSGITLYKATGTYPVLNDLVQDIFFKICGIHEDDTSEGSDAGEMTEGEE